MKLFILAVAVLFSPTVRALDMARLVERSVEHLSRHHVSYLPQENAAAVMYGQTNPECARLHPWGPPATPGSTGFVFICRLFESAVDPTAKSPRWVAELLSDSGNGAHTREGMEFMPDPALPGRFQATLADYRGSGFDRGHLAAAGNFRSNRAAMESSFLFSNIVPQNPDHNRGVWANLEAAVRELAERRGGLHVISGPVYVDTPVRLKNGRLSGSGVAIPAALFKVLIDQKRQEATAFLIPNQAGLGDDPRPFQVSVRDLERLTGIDFNPTLNRVDADRIELGGNWMIPRVRLRFND
jgi:endonuclease G